MIQMTLYNNTFKEEYYKAVLKVVTEADRKAIIHSCKKYFPFGILSNEFKKAFKELILLSFDEIKQTYDYIKNTKKNVHEAECFSKVLVNGKMKLNLEQPYRSFHNNYEKVRDSKKDKVKMNVRLVKESGILICPYCNRDYINCRGNEASGAQLDHFYNRSMYPIFSLSLYNLVPSCSKCNQLKSDKDEKMISPFDESEDFSNGIKFSYSPNANTLPDVVIKDVSIGRKFTKNINVFKLPEAYKMHNIDIQELIDKATIYNKTQSAELIKVFMDKNVNMSNDEIKMLIFGNVKAQNFGRKTISKLTYDILGELGIIQFD